MKERVDFNVHDHHKTELLDENYREIYNQDFKPSKNSKILTKQSSLERADQSDFMNPLKVGYQKIPDDEKKLVHKLKNNDIDQFKIGTEVLATQGSPSTASQKKHFDSRS